MERPTPRREVLQWRDIRDTNPIDRPSDELLAILQTIQYKLQTGFFDAATRMEAALLVRTLQFELGCREKEAADFRLQLDQDTLVALASLGNACR